MFSESPPLSGDTPPSQEKQFIMCNARNMMKSFTFCWADSFHRVNIGKITRICKVNENEISYKHRSEEKRNKRIHLNMNCFANYSNVSVV